MTNLNIYKDAEVWPIFLSCLIAYLYLITPTTTAPRVHYSSPFQCWYKPNKQKNQQKLMGKNGQYQGNFEFKAWADTRVYF